MRALSWYVEFIVVAQRFNYGGVFLKYMNIFIDIAERLAISYP